MSDTPAQFEDRLRQLAPTGCDHLTEATFYQAGWNAAMLSLSQQSSRSARHLRSAVPFASGLLCGLLFCAASIAALTLTKDDLSVVQVGQTQGPAVLDLAAQPQLSSVGPLAADVAQPVSDAARQGIDWFTLSAAFGTWNWNHTTCRRDTIPLASQPLSAAARHQWGSIVSMDASGNTLRTPAASLSETSEQLQFRAFPLSGAAIDELL